MANNLMLNVSPTFSLDYFAQRLADTYRAKGFAVNVINMNGCYILSFDKDTGGINAVLGLGKGIKATCMVVNGTLTISYSEEEWTSKIVACCIGWFLCFIPLITGVVGIVGQLDLSREINNDAIMIAASL